MAVKWVVGLVGCDACNNMNGCWCRMKKDFNDWNECLNLREVKVCQFQVMYLRNNFSVYIFLFFFYCFYSSLLSDIDNFICHLCLFSMIIYEIVLKT